MEPIVELVEFAKKSDAMRAAEIRDAWPIDGRPTLLEGASVELFKMGRDRGYVWCRI